MTQTVRQRNASVRGSSRIKRVLNAGSGPRSPRQLHPVFDSIQWNETRIDIDPLARPDVIGTFTDLGVSFPPASFNAVWSSHSLEHLHRHEVPRALAEFRRVLKPDGFVLIRCPDLETVASLIVDHGPDYVAYISPVGPITVLDMIYGHTASIAQGKTFMSHHTGFTCSSLGAVLLEAGFGTVLAKRDNFDLWGLALMDETNKLQVQRDLASSGLDMNERTETGRT